MSMYKHQIIINIYTGTYLFINLLYVKDYISLIINLSFPTKMVHDIQLNK